MFMNIVLALYFLIYGALIFLVVSLFVKGFKHLRNPQGLKFCKPEVTDLYAWKVCIFGCAKDLKYGVYPFVMQQYGPYDLTGPNYYHNGSMDAVIEHVWKNSIGWTKEEVGKLAKNVFPVVPKKGKASTFFGNHGFYTFKTATQAVEEIGSLGSVCSMYLIAKVRIYGDVLEATRGYKSEYMDILELYTVTDDLVAPIVAADTQNMTYEELIKAFSEHWNRRYRMTLPEAAAALNWPSQITRIKDVTEFEAIVGAVEADTDKPKL